MVSQNIYLNLCFLKPFQKPSLTLIKQHFSASQHWPPNIVLLGKVLDWAEALDAERYH
jgi:hypothetical protein